MSKDEKIGKLVIPLEKEYDELHKNSNGSISSHGSHVIWTKLEMALFEEYQNKSLDVIYLIENDMISVGEDRKYEILITFEKIKKEFRNEKMILFFIINFTFLDSRMNLENMTFM